MQKAVVLGSFDGVHMGHKAVLEAARGYELIAITFEIPPKLTRSTSPFLITTSAEKHRLLKKCGASEIISLRFEDVKDQEAEDFLKEIKRKISPSLIVCGYNYRFGRNALGDAAFIEKFSIENGIAFKLVPCVEIDGEAVSSSRIRELLRNGETERANELLGHAFGFEATVLQGDKRGRTIGFPTVNQAYPKELLSPRRGVYESECIVEGTAYKAISNLGFRPTYRTSDIFCETHIIGFSDNLYGKNLRINFLRFLREEMEFSSLNELKCAIESDIQKII